MKEVRGGGVLNDLPRHPWSQRQTNTPPTSQPTSPLNFLTVPLPQTYQVTHAVASCVVAHTLGGSLLSATMTARGVRGHRFERLGDGPSARRDVDAGHTDWTAAVGAQLPQHGRSIPQSIKVWGGVPLGSSRNAAADSCPAGEAESSGRSKDTEGKEAGATSPQPRGSRQHHGNRIRRGLALYFLGGSRGRVACARRRSPDRPGALAADRSTRRDGRNWAAAREPRAWTGRAVCLLRTRAGWW